MTQEQALSEFQQMYPDDIDRLFASRERFIGPYGGHKNTFHLWRGTGEIVGTSHISWEQALDEARSKSSGHYTADDSPILEEV